MDDAPEQSIDEHMILCLGMYTVQCSYCVSKDEFFKDNLTLQAHVCQIMRGFIFCRQTQVHTIHAK